MKRALIVGAVAGSLLAFTVNLPLWALAATAAFVIGCCALWARAEAKS